MTMLAKSTRTVRRRRPLARRKSGAFLQGADGARIALTPELYEKTLAYVLGEGADPSRLATVEEAARILEASPRTVERMVDAGALHAVRTAGRGGRLLDVDEVLAYRRGQDRIAGEALEDLHELSASTGGYDMDYSGYLDGFGE